MTIYQKLMQKLPSRTNNYAIAIGWTLWVMAAFFIASFAIAILLYILQQYGVVDINKIGTVTTLLINAGLYVTMFFVVMWLPWRQQRKNQNQGKRKEIKNRRRVIWKFLTTSVGLKRLANVTDLKYFVAGLPVFYMAVIGASVLAALFLSSDTMNQTQDVGFAATESGLDLVVIFVAMVVVAPLFEEMVMSGFLFGKLRKHLPMWPSAVLVSLLFALAHGQINVGIMTFILSMFSCRMREKTGAIWAGLFLHITVNLVSYSIRFLSFSS